MRHPGEEQDQRHRQRQREDVVLRPAFRRHGKDYSGAAAAVVLQPVDKRLRLERRVCPPIAAKLVEPRHQFAVL